MNSSELPALITHGSWFLIGVLALAAGAALAAGHRVSTMLSRRSRSRRRRALGAPSPSSALQPGERVVVEGVLLPGRDEVPRHGEATPVLVSSAWRRGDANTRRARRVAVETADGWVFARGLPRVRVGSSESSTRDVEVAGAVNNRYMARVWLPSQVRALVAGDPVLISGKLVRHEQRAERRVLLLDDCELAHSGELQQVVELSTRVKHALVAVFAALALLTLSGYAAVKLAGAAPSIGLRWAAANYAAMTPLRARGLEAAMNTLELRIVAPLPDLESLPPQAFRFSGPAVDALALARYLQLARLRKDCEHAPNFLQNIAVSAPGITAESAELLLECKRKTDVATLANFRFWASDFAQASELASRAAVRWGEDDQDQLYASSLKAGRYQSEVYLHTLAGRYDRAADTLSRSKLGNGAEAVECARLALAAASGDAPALKNLEAKSGAPLCAVHLLGFRPRQQRKELLERTLEADATRTAYLYQLRAFHIDFATKAGVSVADASLLSSTERVESPHEMLSFPHGARVKAPAVFLQTLAELDRLQQPAPGQRLVRARLRASLARYRSSLAQDEQARRLIRGARADFTAVVAALAQGPEQSEWRRSSLELEALLAGVEEINVELLAGNLAAARRLSDALELPPESDALKYDRPKALASLELTRGFIELWQGRAGRLQRFVDGDCKELSSCFVLRGDLASLVKAATARGDLGSCEEIECLLAARRPENHPALQKALLRLVGMASVEGDPLNRLNYLGQCRRLARLLRDRDKLGVFDGWLALIEKPALDLRLVVAEETTSKLLVLAR